MALFTMERYLGEEKPADDTVKKKFAQDTLDLLRSRALGPKKCQIFDQSPATEDEPDNPSRKRSLDTLQNKPRAKKKKIGKEKLNVSNKETSYKTSHPDPGSEVENFITSQIVEQSKQANGRQNNPDIENKPCSEADHVNTRELYDPLEQFKCRNENKIGNFTLLCGDTVTSSKKVRRVLPKWLSLPTTVEDISSVSYSTIHSFKAFNNALENNMKQMGITVVFPVQYRAIPALLKDSKHGAGPTCVRPNDICVSAPTGSGKTLAFAFPILQMLVGRVTPATRAIVVLPTRELAAQVYNVFLSLCRNTNVRCVLLSGVRSMTYERATLLSSSKYDVPYPPDIVICTPGRLVDHLKFTTDWSLKCLRFLVIDEADRMIDLIKQNWLKEVEEAIQAHPSMSLKKPLNLKSSFVPAIPLQKLLFSATLSADPEKLEQLNLFQPRLFTAVIATKRCSEDDASTLARHTFIRKYTTPVGLQEHMIVCTGSEKPLCALHLILKHNRSLCFTGSLETTRRLSLLVQLYNDMKGNEREFKCAEISSSVASTKRRKTLRDFHAGKIDALICSDSMARGIDAQGVSCVILYDAPSLIKTYIHRVGRTARAGQKGVTYTLLRKEEVFHFKKMLSDAGKQPAHKMKIKTEELACIRATYEKVLPLVASKLKELES